ncbi:MAG: ATP-binding protein, partial [Myxococcaceae bacterium]
GEVPAAVRDRLFERFVTRSPQGTGLGLAIARSVAEAHGGALALLEPGPPQVVLRLRLPQR